MIRIDLNHVWDDAKAMGRANKDLLAAIAGMFILLPAVIAEQLLKPVASIERNASVERMIEVYAQSFSANWPVELGHSIVTSFGTLAMLTLLLRPERLTVSESLRAALIILPGYYIASLLQSLGVGVGLLLFFVPGFYLIARFALIAPVAAAEGRANPIEILIRSFELTRGNGWRIFALLAVLFVTGFIVSIVATSLVGLIASMLLPPDVAKLSLSILAGVLEAGIAALIALVTAALYRAATAPVKIASIFE